MVEVVQPRATPVEVVKRGQRMWTDETGAIVEKRVLTAEELEAEPDAPAPDYITFHNEVLNGANPIELQSAVEDGKPLDVPNEPVVPPTEVASGSEEPVAEETA